MFRFFVVLMLVGLLASAAAPALKADPAAKTVKADKTAKTAKEGNRYDVVVIGSELEGVLLAKAAHDLGLKVLILDPREKPGGQLIQGKMLVLDEPKTNQKKSLIQGELRKLYDGYNAGTLRTDAQFEKYYNRLIAGIPLASGVHIQNVQTDPEGAGDLQSLQSLTFQKKDRSIYTVQSRYWVENTDFAALTSMLKVKRIPGVESIFHGDKPDYMAATYMLKFKNVNWNKLHSATLKSYPLTRLEKQYGPNTYVDYDFGTGFSNITAKYKPHDPQLRLRGINSTYQKNGEVIMNALLIYNVNPADSKSVDAAIKKAKAEASGILKFLRANLPGYERAELNGFPNYLYIRDYDRYETEYVLQVEDLMNTRMFWDNVSIGGYPVDIQGTQSVPNGKGYGKPDHYGIPLRSFELKSYENVLVAGKNIGASAKAYGSARVTPTTGLAGETIGIILGSELNGKSLRELTLRISSASTGI